MNKVIRLALFRSSEELKYRIVQLGKDYPGKIWNWAEARNSFLKNGWVFFLDHDEEAPRMLLDYLDDLEPEFPYYWIRRINLHRGKYVPYMNPDYVDHLASDKVRYRGNASLMMEANGARKEFVYEERVFPKDPHGMIDYPIIHDHDLPFSGHKRRLRLKKLLLVLKGR